MTKKTIEEYELYGKAFHYTKEDHEKEAIRCLEQAAAWRYQADDIKETIEQCLKTGNEQAAKQLNNNYRKSVKRCNEFIQEALYWIEAAKKAN